MAISPQLGKEAELGEYRKFFVDAQIRGPAKSINMDIEKKKKQLCDAIDHCLTFLLTPIVNCTENEPLPVNQCTVFMCFV